MEAIPPSYESATARDAWAIIAHYIPSSDLCAASLVSRRWHEIFIPFLWGDPASHFGTENDAVYVALTRFRRTLKRARLGVRMLTHTLHLPPALSEIYDGPRPEWLRDILDYLPCLQSLIVSKLPFFDHNAMVALKHPSNYGQSTSPEGLRTYNLRLLLAEREPNTTSLGIAEALSRFPALIYLDLSYTTPARDLTVLSTLSQLEDLQVLKLRGIGLKDSDAEFLANAIGTRVRFLDLRDNLLTDMAVRSLMQASFGPPARSSTRMRADEGMQGQTLSVSQPTFSSYSAEFLKRADLDETILERLTRPLTGRSLVENLPHVGITHLCIADNQLTLEGVASLITTKLHVLDVGTVDTAESIKKGQRTIGNADSTSFPGAEKLIPILGTYAKENLTYLRAHHAVVTGDAPVKDITASGALLPELPGLGLEASQRYSELPPTNEVFELPEERAPRYELADTSVEHITHPGTEVGQNDIRCPYEDEPLPQMRRGSAFAPEVIERQDLPDDERVILNATGTGVSLSRSNPEGERPPSSAVPSPELCPTGPQPIVGPSLSSVSDLRNQKIQELLAKRPKNKTIPLRDSKDYAFPYLHPSHVPHIETLVLTDVPSTVPASSPILSSLIRFVTACSDEALLATLQSRSDYSLPPGRARIDAEKQQSRTLFALRRLILEITPVSKLNSKKLGTWKPHDAGSKSSTGDRDSEKLWSAAMDDFSFFDGLECGVLENDPGKYFPMAILNEKVSLTPEDDDSMHSGRSELDSPLPANSLQPSPGLPHQRLSRPSSMTLSPTSAVGPHGSSSLQSSMQAGESTDQRHLQEPEIDLVSALAAFRRSKKAEYEELVRADRQQRYASGASSSLLSPSSTTFSMSGYPSPSPTLSPTIGAATARSVPLSVEGHWKGEMKIVRNAAPKGRSGVVDMFGNYFEKGYLYP